MPSSSSKHNGRWVILFDDHTPPAFWSSQREALESICLHLRQTCPSARVVWQDATPSAGVGGVPIIRDGDES